MKRFLGMLRRIGWLWAAILALDLFLGFYVTWVYFLVIPGLILAMAYFTYMRYDEDGNRKET